MLTYGKRSADWYMRPTYDPILAFLLMTAVALAVFVISAIAAYAWAPAVFCLHMTIASYPVANWHATTGTMIEEWGERNGVPAGVSIVLGLIVSPIGLLELPQGVASAIYIGVVSFGTAMFVVFVPPAKNP